MLRAAGQTERFARHDVRLRLSLLFAALWLLAAFHLLVLLRHETWPHGRVAILMCAAPPVVPFIHLAWGKLGSASLFGAVALLMAGACWGAVRHPESRGWRDFACAAIVAYWLFHDFVLGAFS